MSPGISALTMPVPPTATAAWTSIHWRTLAVGDPLALVRSVLRWRGGFIALGSDDSVWTSADGARWDALPFDTATTFWPGLIIVGVAEVPAGLIALTLLSGTWGCSSTSVCPTYGSSVPLMAWTSSDGRTWTPHTGPDIGTPAQWQGPPLVAAGLAGLVVVSPESPASVGYSADGIHWQKLAATAFPAGLRIRDVVGAASGFTAVGFVAVDPDHERAVAVQSIDGTTWTGPYPLDLASASAPSVILASTGPSWEATRLVAAASGLIAVGSVLATPGASLWWRSVSGKAWHLLPAYWPLGPTTCQGEGCGSQPDGLLVGDGTRMVALRGGASAGFWASSDGLAWQQLPTSGSAPSEQALHAVLLPGGVLVSDGTTTWFGEAQAQ